MLVNGALGAGELDESRRRSTLRRCTCTRRARRSRCLGRGRRTRAGRPGRRVLCVSDRSRDGLIALGVDEPNVFAVFPPVVIARRPPSPESIGSRAGRSSAPPRRTPARDRVRRGRLAQRRRPVRPGRPPARRRRRAGGSRGSAVGAGRSAGFSTTTRRSSACLDASAGSARSTTRRRTLPRADLLVMTSREDPQPLVPLEAALVGTPTVGFAHRRPRRFRGGRGGPSVRRTPTSVALAD